ncbi:ATP-binding cassette domain-containing protein [Amycolatopsis sp. NPDC050768]|uniref:ABC transporter ATP-binding protein n=1 Tax=Amycolatopsis sp. NPDC050768 TaxID=3154839 RepID=UPI0034074913
MADAILDLDSVFVRFGGLVAVGGVSFSVERGSVTGLVGPNGAGKTTLFNAISGLVPVTGGAINLRTTRGSADLTRVGAWRRAGLGIGRTFQDSRLVAGLPVLDQLATGAFAGRSRFLGAVLRGRSFLADERQLVDRAHEVFAQLKIEHQAAVNVDLLSAPERRLVDLGRALMSRPELLLLDEISAGMPVEDKEMVADRVLDYVRSSGATVIFVEHDMGFVRRVADRTVVLAEGEILADGGPEEVLRRPDVLAAYIGPGAEGALR